jgi:hypothetical protein
LVPIVALIPRREGVSVTGSEHHAKAEDLIHQATCNDRRRQKGPPEYATPERAIAAAQAHAILALAATLGSSDQTVLRTMRAPYPGQLTDLLTRPVGTGETTWVTGDAERKLRLVSETRQNVGDVEDARRSAHNPEVEGSNPSPATKARGPLSNRKRASGLCFVS